MSQAQLLGVYPVGPEEFLCALFHVGEAPRFLPVWLAPVEGARLLARLNGWTPNRPHAVDALADLARAAGGAAGEIELSDVHEGVFRATLRLGDGTDVDLRPSDALAVALELDLPVEVTEDVLASASLWLSADDASRYFDVDIETGAPDAVAEADSGSDAEFEAFLRQLGAADDDEDDGADKA